MKRLICAGFAVASRFGATCGDTLVRVQLENLKKLQK